MKVEIGIHAWLGTTEYHSGAVGRRVRFKETGWTGHSNPESFAAGSGLGWEFRGSDLAVVDRRWRSFYGYGSCYGKGELTPNLTPTLTPIPILTVLLTLIQVRPLFTPQP